MAHHTVKLCREELSAARCVNGIPMALIAAVHEGEAGVSATTHTTCNSPSVASRGPHLHEA